LLKTSRNQPAFKANCQKWLQEQDDKQQQEKQGPAATVSFAAGYLVSVEGATGSVVEDWLLHTGASRNMSPNRALFVNYETAASVITGKLTVKVADGRSAAVAGIGDVRMVTSVKGVLVKHMMKDACAPCSWSTTEHYFN
jgi:hypothetical protein